MCAPVTEEIRKRLGVNVYGVDAGSLQKSRGVPLKREGAADRDGGVLHGRPPLHPDHRGPGGVGGVRMRGRGLFQGNQAQRAGCAGIPARGAWSGSAPKWPAPWPWVSGGSAARNSVWVSPVSPGRSRVRINRSGPSISPWRMKSGCGSSRSWPAAARGTGTISGTSPHPMPLDLVRRYLEAPAHGYGRG